MTNASPAGNPPPARPQAVVQIGPLKLRGLSAQAFLAGLVALIVWAIIRNKPWVDPSPMWISAALWIWFQVYWTVNAARAAASKSSESPASRAVHTRLFLASLVLYFLHIPGANGPFLPLDRWVWPVGVAIQAGGLWFAILARKTLGKHWSGELTVKEGHEIVSDGPYRWVRHPIYTGILSMGLGTAVTSNSWHALAGFAVMAFAYGRKIRMEERWLLEAFGSNYAKYRDTRKALIPWLL